MPKARQPVHCSDGTIWIFLTQDKVAIVDKEDVDLAQFNWFAEKRDRLWYARRDTQADGIRTRLYLHRAIANRKSLPIDLLVDHENCDGLDNRRDNLREANHSQNLHNTRRRSDNTSGFKGVSWSEASGKWIARIKIDGNYKIVCRSDDRQKCATAYADAANEYFGIYARIS